MRCELFKRNKYILDKDREYKSVSYNGTHVKLGQTEWKYLISYGFTRQVASGYEERPFFNEGGTGRAIITIPFEISTEEDLLKVENICKEKSNIDNLVNFSIYSFHELEK